MNGALAVGPAHLYDAATGERLAELDPGSPRRRIAFLADARPLLARPNPEGVEILVFPPDGAEEPRRHLLAGARRLRLGGQPDPAGLILALSREEKPPFLWRPVRLDLETGATRDLPAGLVPATLQVGWGGDLLGPGSAASRLFLRDRTLVLLDLSTGREQVLTGPGARR